MKRVVYLLLLGLASMALFAQPLTSATPDQLEQQLAPRTRSIRNLSPQQQSVNLIIQFDFDSAKLQEASKPLLNNLAVAMQRDRLKELIFKVEGHTDAKGATEYNQQLSERRAASVVNYLQEQGVDVNRLVFEGKGFSELLIPEKPLAMENRRVKVAILP